MSEYYGILISFMLPFSRKVAENMLLQEISDIAESLPVAVLVVSVIPPPKQQRQVSNHPKTHQSTASVHFFKQESPLNNNNNTTLLPLRLSLLLRLRLLPLLPFLHQLENPQIQRDPIPQPRRPLRMIPLLLSRSFGGIRMHQRTQRSPINHQPGDECAELRWCEDIDFEHGDGVGAEGSVEEGVDAEFGDWIGRI